MTTEVSATLKKLCELFVEYKDTAGERLLDYGPDFLKNGHYRDRRSYEEFFKAFDALDIAQLKEAPGDTVAPQYDSSRDAFIVVHKSGLEEFLVVDYWYSSYSGYSLTAVHPAKREEKVVYYYEPK